MENERRIYEPVRVDEREGLNPHQLMRRETRRLVDEFDLKTSAGIEAVRDKISTIARTIFPGQPESETIALKWCTDQVAQAQVQKEEGIPIEKVIPQWRITNFEERTEEYFRLLLPDSV